MSFAAKYMKVANRTAGVLIAMLVGACASLVPLAVASVVAVMTGYGKTEVPPWVIATPVLLGSILGIFTHEMSRRAETDQDH